MLVCDHEIGITRPQNTHLWLQNSTFIPTNTHIASRLQAAWVSGCCILPHLHVRPRWLCLWQCVRWMQISICAFMLWLWTLQCARRWCNEASVCETECIFEDRLGEKHKHKYVQQFYGGLMTYWAIYKDSPMDFLFCTFRMYILCVCAHLWLAITCTLASNPRLSD